MFPYQLFDAVIWSEQEFPELTVRPPGAPPARSLTIVFDAPRPAAAVGRGRLRPWLADGDPVLRGRFGDWMLIRALGLADFWVRPENGRVRCRALPGVAAASVRHFLLNQVLPRLLSRGALVLHASAVAAGSGAIALIGPAGHGKSTLAASFASSDDARLIADDGVLVSSIGGLPALLGAYACTRLRSDSAAAVGRDGRRVLDEAPRGAKQVMRVGTESPDLDGPVPARGFFLLETARTGERQVRVERLGGTASVMAVVANSFILDPDDRDLMRRQFSAAAALVGSGVPFFAVSYPRDFAELPRVRACLLDALPA